MSITDTEVILEDTVYDLKAFSKVHPGGSYMLNIFGGKNATIHYYMLHPHLKIRNNILDKYKLRKNNDNNDNSIYLLNSDKYIELKKKVYNSFAYTFWKKVY